MEIRVPRYRTTNPELDRQILELAEQWVPPDRRDLFVDVTIAALSLATTGGHGPVEVKLDRKKQETRVLPVEIDRGAIVDKESLARARRNLRIPTLAMIELAEAVQIFNAYHDRRKVTIFGSARESESSPLFDAAFTTGELFANHDWDVITGAGPGIMKAGTQGAGHSKAFGLRIRVPFEETATEYFKDDHLITFRYFFTRKLFFVKEAHAFVIFPGGWGTADELYEFLTLQQTGKVRPAPLVLQDEPGGDFWIRWEQLEKERAEKGYIGADDWRFFELVWSPEDAWSRVADFYRVYHSMEFIEDNPEDEHGFCVIRLQPRNEENHDLLDRINDTYLSELTERFRDIIRDGEISRSAPLPYEIDRGLYLDYERIGFFASRRHFARYVELLDELNGITRRRLGFGNQ